MTFTEIGEGLTQADAAGSRSEIATGLGYERNPLQGDVGSFSQYFDNARVGLVQGQIIGFGSRPPAPALQDLEDTIHLGYRGVGELFPLELNAQFGILAYVYF
jgi:hypothetical protein